MKTDNENTALYNAWIDFKEAINGTDLICSYNTVHNSVSVLHNESKQAVVFLLDKDCKNIEDVCYCEDFTKKGNMFSLTKEPFEQDNPKHIEMLENISDTFDSVIHYIEQAFDIEGLMYLEEELEM